MAEFARFITRRERRFRRLRLLVFIALGVMIGLWFLSFKVSILDNDMASPEWITFENENGDELSGLVMHPRDPSGGLPSVIVVHDLTGHKEQLNRLSFELVRHGYLVFAIDLRDHGRSQGETTFGDYYGGEPWDIVAAYDYLTEKVDHVDPGRIALVGDGFGGAQVLMATDILAMENKSVTATVAWGPPMDVSGLRADERSWENLEVYLDRRISDVDWKYVEDRDNRSVIEHIGSPNWTVEDIFVIYGEQDPFIPQEQFYSLPGIGELQNITEADHDLSEDEEVLSSTIRFLERRLTPSETKEIDFNYKEVEAVNSALNFSIIAVMVLGFLTLYEAAVLKKTARSYIPEISKESGLLRLGVFTLLDIVAYTFIALMMSRLYIGLEEGAFMGILPGSRFFTTVLAAGIVLIVWGIVHWWGITRFLSQDEERTEESCGNLRGLALALLALLIIIANFLFGQMLLIGPNYPKTLTYILPLIIIGIFFLGHEIWVRKIIHPKINTMLRTLFIKRQLPFHLVFFAVMYGIYALLMLVMFTAIGAENFGPDFWLIYGALVSVIGLVSTILYHRSKSILASLTYSVIVAPWLLNLVYHF
jgi:dienelactone hydrolase